MLRGAHGLSNSVVNMLCTKGFDLKKNQNKNLALCCLLCSLYLLFHAVQQLSV